MSLSDYDRFDPAGAELTLGEGRSIDGTPQLILCCEDEYGPSAEASNHRQMTYSLDAEAVVNLALTMLQWATPQLPEKPEPGHAFKIGPKEYAATAEGCLLAASMGMVNIHAETEHGQ